MKKIICLLLALLLLFGATACGTGNVEGGGEGNGDGSGDNVGNDNSGGGSTDSGSTDDQIDYNVIFSTDVSPTIITAEKDIPANITSKLYNALKDSLGKAPYTSSDSGEYKGHEIIIGKSSRDISATAYTKLKRLTGYDDDETVSWLVYSDGLSIAIAYEDDSDYIGLSGAIDKIIADYVVGKTKLKAKKDVLISGAKSVDEFYTDYDAALLEEKWARFAAALDPSYSDKVTAAMKSLYSIYSDKLIDWFTDLYDPGVGGFYYSNSGRNTYGFLPDIESTSQALGFISASGMAEEYGGKYYNMIPTDMQRDIVYFFKSLQDPENGYFYHPQWSRELSDSKISRLSRDLGNAVSVLKALGSAPTYSTPNGDKGDGITAEEYLSQEAMTPKLSTSVATAVSKAVLAASVPARLESKETFLAYLATLDITNNSYSVGNTLTAQKSAIINRDKQLKKEGADYSLMDILIDWLNANQHEDTGLWHHTVNYYAINGLMKISGVYGGAEVLLPNAAKAVKAAVEAITSDEEVGAVVDIYNTWYAIQRVLRHMNEYGDEDDRAEAAAVLNDLRANAAEALDATREKVLLFRKDDGSFSYTKKSSSANSQGCPVAVPGTNEGDVNATVICTSDIVGNIYRALDLEKVFVPIYTKSDARRYLANLEKLTPVVKDTEETKDEPLDFESNQVGDSPAGLTVNNRSAANGGLIQVVEGYTTNKTNVVSISSKNGTSDAINIDCANFTPKPCYVFECDFAVKSSSSNYYAQITLGDCYLFTLRQKNGKVQIVESSSTSSKKSKDTDLGVTPELGEWFSIKVEYFVLENGEARIKFYYNGELIAVTDNYYDPDGLKLENGAVPKAPTEYKKTSIWMMKTVDADIYIDNIACYKSDAVYTPVTGSNSPKINVDAK